jgi:hypothetical protein
LHTFSNSVHRYLLLLLSVITTVASAQIGGYSSFQFMNVSPAARISALGGVNVSKIDQDINFFTTNPASAGDTLAGMASASYQFYVGDIGQALFTYAHNMPKLGPVIFGIQNIHYGTIQGYDAGGIATNEFNAGETAFMVSSNHQVANFRAGATLKGVLSNLAGYRASAMMLDLGGVFIHPKKPFTVGLAIKNIGVVFNHYGSGNSSKLPFDVQVGTTFKPEHMPLRFSITAYNLVRPDVTYYDPASDAEKPGTAKKIFSHINFGTEILIHKKITIMVGYNYLVHQSLKLSGGGAGAGLSFGFSAAIKSVEFVFSRSAYVAGNSGYSFTLSTNVNRLLTRR